MVHETEEPAKQSIQSPESSHAHNSVSPEDDSDKSTLMHITPAPKTCSVLLASVLVKVIGPHGHSILARGLVDQCAQSSFISESLCQRLRLKGRNTNVEILGLAGNKQASCKKSVSFKIKPHFHSPFACDVDAFVVSKVSSYIPGNKIVFSNWKHIQGLTLADPQQYEERGIELLLSAAIHAKIVKDQVKKGGSGEPIATCTALGWMLSGDVQIQQVEPSEPSTVLHCLETEDLTDLLRKFWEQEDFQPSRKILTPEEQECEDFFMSNYNRDFSGHFIVRLPFKDDETAEKLQIGNSYSTAKRMLDRMERRFVKDDHLQEKYKAFMREYINLKHMKVANPETDLDGFYLPHHAVWKESSATTKLRVVFNGSQKTDKGISLNDKLHIGPNLLPDLADVVLRWRTYRFAFTADIEKMFRQVLVDERDQHLQKILWRFDANEPVLSYQLKTVTYGLACSPYLANRCVRELGRSEGAHYPLAAPVLLDEIYMDDVLTGEHTLENARRKQEELINMLMVSGFPLRKWAANDQELLEWLPQEVVAADPGDLPQPESRMAVLGLSWVPQEDNIFFRISIDPVLTKPITKRNVLSNISKLFDPLEPRVTDEELPPLKRWLLLSQMSQHFWDRWSAEYLKSIQCRSKWTQESPALTVGDVVLIKNEMTSPAKWPLAVITDLHPGSDGLARVATVRTATSTFKRPIVKLILLITG
ncbi:uncharacterized protein LOC124173968 [Ischnura elegans]|uniref:uncharacterized protein LOC124173968 n=1 Tax=Ischnura elegans TaxID=197161 RepID=UPI001ED86B54|nr:uncharacterized protein LOC124173968 [Ischnura elegans]